MTADAKLIFCSTRLKSYIHLSQRTTFSYKEVPYEDWTMLICEEGVVEFRVGDHMGEAKAGDIVLCPPGVVLYRKALTIISFHFAVFELHALSEESAIPFPYCGKFTFRHKTQFLLLVEHMKDSRESISLHYTEHLLNDILYQFIREKNVSKEQHKSLDPLIAEAVRFIHEHVYEEVSTQAAADHVGMYQSQFTRKFQKEMGVPPSRYMTVLRLQKVSTLLIETDDSLENIAHQCGYQNAFYLSRVFSKEMNISPSRYRNNHRV